VKNKIMPPWFAAKTHGTWENDASLTKEDREALGDWIAGGMPEGDPSEAPLPRPWPSGLKIGKPDVTFSIPMAISVPASGVVPYQYVIVPTNFDHDVWISAAEVTSVHSELLHHVTVYVRKAEDVPGAPKNGIAGSDELIATRVPGNNWYEYPRGVARRIPKGAVLVYQIHITPNGIAGEVKPEVEFRISTATSPIEAKSYTLVNTTFVIPPNAPDHRVEATKKLDQPTRLISFMPHMHVRGKAFRFEAKLPNGSDRVLLDIPKYDFNWQLRYLPSSPVDLPAGTTLAATAWFDNSEDNPANPDPSKEVRWGEQTTEEMMIGFIEGYPLR
jgi:hypothetical protein